jgi:hypothetical protein
MADDHRIGEPPLAAAEPGAGRLAHLRGGRPGRVERESDAVGRDRLRADRTLAAPGDLRRDVRAETLGPAAGDDVLGDLLEPYDLVRAGAGELPQLDRPGDQRRGQPGVDEQIGDPRRPQQPAGDLLDAQVGAPLEIVVERRVPGQVEQRGADRAHRHAHLGVRQRSVEPARTRRLAQLRLETGTVERLPQHAVAVVVDEAQLHRPSVAYRGAQPFSGVTVKKCRFARSGSVIVAIVFDGSTATAWP